SAAADLVSENVPEDPQIKGEVLARVHALAPARAILTTNSSSLIPSMFAAMTGRPERLLALHFHKTVWVSNVVDVMPHSGTNLKLVGVVTEFARSIRQIPIVLQRETQGYVFNSMLQAYMTAAMALWASGTASIEDIDRAWMVAERSEHGPFGAMDYIGLDTIYHIMKYWAEASKEPAVAVAATKLKAEFIDRGRLGAKSGLGFYRYPHPAFQDPLFLDPMSQTAASD
ncbi:MAG: 3-hydroxyacyl-CoA dehydrogenase NAD-binding domain-containing protein, partial [Phenylobacterium sp.]